MLPNTMNPPSPAKASTQFSVVLSTSFPEYQISPIISTMHMQQNRLSPMQIPRRLSLIINQFARVDSNLSLENVILPLRYYMCLQDFSKSFSTRSHIQ